MARSITAKDNCKEDKEMSASSRRCGAIATSHTDKLIVKLHRQGVSIARIARRIGRPGDHERVKQALEREKDKKNDTND